MAQMACGASLSGPARGAKPGVVLRSSAVVENLLSGAIGRDLASGSGLPLAAGALRVPANQPGRDRRASAVELFRPPSDKAGVADLFGVSRRQPGILMSDFMPARESLDSRYQAV